MDLLTKGSSIYPEVIEEIRKQKTKETLEIQQKIEALYGATIKDLAKQVAAEKEGTLGHRFKKEYTENLKRARRELQGEIKKATTTSIEEAARLGIKGNTDQLEALLATKGITVSSSFRNTMAQVQQNVVADIIKGNLYKDRKTLDDRLWNYGKSFEKDLQYVMAQGLIQKKSAIELAEDLEMFVKFPARRETDWGKSYPWLKNRKVDYNAMRLARTAINHSYQTATIQTAKENPFTKGILWQSALAHGRTCQLCIERHGKVYDPDDVPLDHPNGLCTMVPNFEKNITEISKELDDWLQGGENEALGEWFDERKGMFEVEGKTLTKGNRPEPPEEKGPGGKLQKISNELEELRKQVEQEGQYGISIPGWDLFVRDYGKMEQHVKVLYKYADGDEATILKEYIRKGKSYAAKLEKIKELERLFMEVQLPREYKYWTEADLQGFVKKAYNSFSKKEEESLRYYVGTSYSFEINRFLYTGAYDRSISRRMLLGPSEETLVKRIDALEKTISKQKLPKNMILTRFAEPEEALAIFKRIDPALETEGLKLFTKNLTDEEFINKTRELTERAAGTQYKNNSFMSTSYESDMNVFRKRKVIVKAYADQGTEALITDNWGESEVVLNKGSDVEVMGFGVEGKGSNKKLVINLRVKE